MNNYSEASKKNKSKLKQIDVASYLQRLKLAAQPADLSFLKKLHKAHLLHVPFENLDIHYGRKITLDADHIFNKIVLELRGGICYELNILFFHLLTQLGYSCHLLSAQVFKNNTWSPDFDHAMILVTIGDEQWLVDAGFGQHFVEPKN